MTSLADVAYYYPAPYWHWSEGGWIKTLLLFFDRLAILLPDYMRGRHTAANPTLVLPLEERGLLEVLEPREWVDQEVTEQLATVIAELLTQGAFDDLPEAPQFAELSQSRMGYGADVELAHMLVEELQTKGLARSTQDGVSISLHPIVRKTILVTLAQLARNAGLRRGMKVHPATSEPDAISDLINALAREPLPSVGHVVSFDLEGVSLNLDDVSLDDVLAFREEHGAQHKAYWRDAHRFAAQVALEGDPSARDQLFLERRDELAEAAYDLRRLARKRFRRRLGTWSLGFAGGIWGIVGSDPLGVALGAASQVLDLLPSPNHVTAFSYLFSAEKLMSKSH